MAQNVLSRNTFIKIIFTEVTFGSKRRLRCTNAHKSSGLAKIACDRTWIYAVHGGLACGCGAESWSSMGGAKRGAKRK